MIDLLKSLLERPALFDFYQATVGENHAKRLFVQEWLRPKPGDRVLDIGCGTGAVVPFLPETVDITAIDISEDYITAAHARHGERASFRVADAADPNVDLGDGFDVAYAFGVFHHLPDDAAGRLLDGAMARLRPGGRFVSVDPTLVEGQGWLSRFFVKNDRGQHIRTPGEMEALFGHHDPETDVRTDLLRIPFAKVLMRVRKSLDPTN